MRIVDLNRLATQAHENAVKHGWWEKERNNQHHLMLVIAEIAEAVEADRDKKHARLSEYRDAKDKERAFRRFIKDSVEDELADVAIYLFDIAGKLGINFTVMRPCRYYRAFEKFKFTDNAFGLCKGLCKETIAIEKRIAFAVHYVIGWSKSLGIDIFFFIDEKMKYNETRPYLHNKDY